jgi:N-acetylmuramoyl-L-alanine amidase
VGVLLLAAGFGLLWVLGAGASAPDVAIESGSAGFGGSISSQDGTPSLAASADAQPGSGVVVEVPGVVGKSVRVAEALITAAGLTSQTRVSDVEGFGGSPDAVLKQSPAPGARVQSGSVVTLTYQPNIGSARSGRRFVVVIDAGHQAKPDLTLEPDGPGSAVLKAKVSPGAIGVASGAAESAESLAIALRVRDALKAAGVEVLMVRTADDVNIANSARARVGNKARADLVVRVHQSFSTDGSLEGVTTFYPSGNSWVQAIEPASRSAAACLEDAVVKATGAKRCGISGRSDLSGFNYSTVPTVMIECGYLSNRAEDAKMAMQTYRTKLGNAITVGVIAHLRSL